MHKKTKTVLIDDDTLIHSAWKMVLGEQLVCFTTVEDFLDQEHNISRSSRIYIDQNLGGQISGKEFVPTIRCLGFQEIFIATGCDAESLGCVPDVTAIVGKEPPKRADYNDCETLG